MVFLVLKGNQMETEEHVGSLVCETKGRVFPVIAGGALKKSACMVVSREAQLFRGESLSSFFAPSKARQDQGRQDGVEAVLLPYVR